MQDAEIVVGLLIAVAALATLAGRIGVPYPILFVLGGLSLGFIPGLPKVELPPDLIFLLCLPPLIYQAAVKSSFRALRADVGPIFRLAVGLVLATMAAVAVMARAVTPGLSWPAAFVLGAIVAPPDAAATTSIAGRLPLPRRIVTILEGESLVNDATSLVAYRMAVAAVVTGSFSFQEAWLRFVVGAIVGVAVGLAVGWLTLQARRRLDDPSVELTVSLLTPFAAYLVAEWLEVSGVLAVVSAGLYVGWMGHTSIPPRTRLQSNAVWGMLVFLLNSLLFVLLGLQSRSILAELAGRPMGTVWRLAVLVCLTLILGRMVWVFSSAALVRLAGRSRRKGAGDLPWRHSGVIAWAGLRGVDLLAAALALPLATASGAPFPDRSLIIFLTFCVILATLIVQGLSLPLLIRWLGVGEDGEGKREEVTARLAATRAALARLEELAAEDELSSELVEHLRSRYEHRADHLTPRTDGTDDEKLEEELTLHQRVRRELLDTERRVVIRLRNRGVIHDRVLRRIERDIDLEELRLDA